MSVAGQRGAAKFELVIFDCDGVLVDSEPISNRIVAQMLAEMGIALSTDEVMERFMGRSMQHCVDSIAQMLGRPPTGFAEDTPCLRRHVATDRARPSTR